MGKKFGFTYAPSKVNPRVSVRTGWREVGVTTVPLFKEVFEEFLPKFEEAYKKEGAISSLSQAHRALGTKAFHQSNFGEFISLRAREKEVNKLLTEKYYRAFQERIKKENPKDYILKRPLKTYRVLLTSRFNPTHDKDKARFECFTSVDANGYIVFEIILAPKEVFEKGTSLFKRAAPKKQTRKVSKPTTWKGEKGRWVTLEDGRRIFVPDKFQKQYDNWKNVEKGAAVAWALGTLSTLTTLGAMGFTVLSKGVTSGTAKLLRDPVKKAAVRSIQSTIEKIVDKTIFKTAVVGGIGVVGGFLTFLFANYMQHKVATKLKKWTEQKKKQK